MTTTQKIIKYLATAFAVFLIITIISAILHVGYSILNVCGLIHKNPSTISEDLKTISSTTDEILSLDIDLACTNLNIKSGNDFKVETNNSKITYTNKNGSIKIKEKDRNWFNNTSDRESSLIIYIPEDVTLEEADIDAGAGEIHIEKLSTQELYFELGAGAVYIENLTATENAKIDGGVGKTELKSCEINNLKADMGVGEFTLDGKLTGETKIDSGVGAVNINLKDSRENYTIDVDRGMGNITLNGQKLEADRVYGTGKNHLKIDGGVGEIKIKFKD